MRNYGDTRSVTLFSLCSIFGPAMFCPPCPRRPHFYRDRKKYNFTTVLRKKTVKRAQPKSKIYANREFLSFNNPSNWFPLIFMIYMWAKDVRICNYGRYWQHVLAVRHRIISPQILPLCFTWNLPQLTCDPQLVMEKAIPTLWIRLEKSRS